MQGGLDLARVAPGFPDAGAGSQQVFRCCLEALAHPGRIVELGQGAPASEELAPAAYAIALALLDQDTALWVSPRAMEACTSLRFHTGCAPCADTTRADFALVTDARELTSLEVFRRGSDEFPERSCTLIVQVDALEPHGAWRLSGPGIRGETALCAEPLGAAFVRQWAENHAMFPRGVDLFLACGTRLAGVPRSTRIEV